MNTCFGSSEPGLRGGNGNAAAALKEQTLGKRQVEGWRTSRSSTLLVVLLLGACCTPQPDRLDKKKCDAYLDAVASVGSMLELYAPAELDTETRAAVESVNAAGRRLLSR